VNPIEPKPPSPRQLKDVLTPVQEIEGDENRRSRRSLAANSIDISYIKKGKEVPDSEVSRIGETTGEDFQEILRMMD